MGTQVEMALMLETDPSAILNELITSVRKGGHIGVVGVYVSLSHISPLSAVLIVFWPSEYQWSATLPFLVFM